MTASRPDSTGSNGDGYNVEETERISVLTR